MLKNIVSATLVLFSTLLSACQNEQAYLNAQTFDSSHLGVCYRRVIVTVSDQLIPPLLLQQEGVLAERMGQSSDNNWIYMARFTNCRDWEAVLESLRRDSIMNIAPDHLQKLVVQPSNKK